MSKPTTTCARIIAALSLGPLLRRQIRNILVDLPKTSIDGNLSYLVNERRIVADRNRGANIVYRLPGARDPKPEVRQRKRRPPRAKPPERAPQPVAVARRKPPADTGCPVAGPPYYKGLRGWGGWRK